MHVVTLDQEKQQFSVSLEQDLYAIVKFRREGDVFVITSTHVPSSIQGRGYGNVVMEQVLADIASREGKVIAQCSFVAGYLERNRQWQYLLSR
ncbi:hypothetical protein VII00023_16646 [Vibrio ichthyoenteri ATCC 700023]|uniref:N-acetyltransferase domain-containing protein n=1 Tax=Vibrio ichthyoenteri ATCC 700023 TaxID=870968 RepID=F9RYZ7_9VIBR|nr:GNAT family N-acetyltransferase [Vibrio ichthyoenteri]EGU46175.1 hypothetical protein VII00023_16646 [Vibrio ichthyoenteri ATCC 700023]